jgi:hypothetical protein
MAYCKHSTFLNIVQVTNNVNVSKVKNLQERNTLAYFTVALVTKIQSFISKLECLPLPSLPP